MDTRHHADRAPGASAQVIDEELARLAAAIELVASRPGSRVTLAGFRFGESLIPQLEGEALRRGVRITALWPMGDGPVDLRLEAVDA